jgi:flap endonuclease-1
MGIPKLTKLISDFCDIETTSLTQVSNGFDEAAVDASIFLYRFLHNSNNDSQFILNIIKFITKLKELMLEPIFVLDGRSGKEKITTQNKRRQQKLNVKEKISSLQIDIQGVTDIKTQNEIKLEIQKLMKKSITITKRHIELFKKTLTMLGITYIQCKGEADPLCAALVKQGIAKFCLSNDNDLLAHGCNITCQNFRFSNNYVTVYELSDILNHLNIDYHQFVDMCIMLGTDYNRSIFGITPDIALECVKKYKNIETVLNNLDKINNTIVRKYRDIYGKNIKNLKRPDTNKTSDSFDYRTARRIFKQDINIKENIQTTNLSELTYEWIHSNERLENLEQFLIETVELEPNEARHKMQLINIIWSSVYYKKNAYINRKCMHDYQFPISRSF